ncbi:MAG: di-trans,poly-cis-decaprenylcistransferase [Verrucomicrobia bacterium TMED175]|nr:MAG: di-trans,poly-cis-decaprenylcistransferase [Verrucomicrobia bacterium TMED175]OUW40927.1 MAG: di-trans,poly-cis-decaprenylcistransferase [Verrucomicrobia bacterium TMED175]|tara:strand:+ start:1268 stop:1906 length:639 start_codon:yes stop_codon:yes gene_type:complete
MDGNKRWSVKKNKTLEFSYDFGAKKLFNLTKYIFDNYKCEYVSAFALSRDNLKRSKKTIDIIIKIFEKYIDEQILNLSNNEFNLRIIGNFSFLSLKIKRKIEIINLHNKKNKKNLIIFFNYSGADDINLASKKVSFKKSKNQNLTNFLMTKSIPDPDILIRSGGFQRLSDFLIYQTRYTEFFFLKKLWPDLKTLDIKKCINSFSKIKRKYGI